MKRVAITGTQNGTNTAFTLAEASAIGSVVFIVRNGQILQQVDQDLSGMQVVIDGTALTLGTPPVAGELLWAFISTSLSLGLSFVTVAGVQDGLSTEYLLSTTVPANSHLLVFRNGQVQEEVVSAPIPGQFSVSGATLTWGLAPTAEESIQVLVESAALVFFRVLPLVALSTSLYTVGITAPVGFQPVYLCLYNGLALKEVTTPPVASEFRILQNGTQLQLGFPLPSDGVLALYAVTLTLGLAAAPSLPRYLDAQNELIVLMNATIDLEEAKLCLTRRWQKLWSGWQWSFVKHDKVFSTIPPKSTGTIAVAQDSMVVAGAGTAFTLSDVGAYLTAGAEFYRVADVVVLNATVQVLMLETPYHGANDASQDYTLHYVDYPLDIDTMDVLVMSMPEGALVEMSQSTLDEEDSSRMGSGPPVRFVRKGLVNDRYMVTLDPFPDARYTIRYIGLQRSILTDAGTLLPDVSSAFLVSAKEMACGIVASKRAAEQDYQGGLFWMGKAEEAMVDYQGALRTLKSRDRLRFGRNAIPFTPRPFNVFAEDPQLDW